MAAGWASTGGTCSRGVVMRSHHVAIPFCPIGHQKPQSLLPSFPQNLNKHKRKKMGKGKVKDPFGQLPSTSKGSEAACAGGHVTSCLRTCRRC